jgi:hypothetical protein
MLNQISLLSSVVSQECFLLSFVWETKERSKEKFRDYEKISKNSRTELVEVSLHSLRFLNSFVPP